MRFILLLFIIPSWAFAFEWEAGIRENFLTNKTYSYNSDSASRIRRELFDRGYRRISLHPRLQYAGDERSLFFMPAIKSPLTDLGVMNARVSQANGYMTIKPMIFNNPGLGEARPAARINPLKPEVALASYDQQISLFLQLSRQHDVDRLVVGSGITHLLRDEKNVARFEAMLRGFRKRLTPSTELILEINGAVEVKALEFALLHNFDLSHLVEGIAYVPDADQVLNFESLKNIRVQLEGILPGLPVHLSRIVIPSCLKTEVSGGELYCADSEKDLKNQVTKFINFKKDLIALENQGILFRTVEILEANTDFEPKNPDPRYPYYNPNFNDPLIYELPKKPIAVLPAFPIPETTGKKIACVLYDKNDLPPQVDRIGDIHSVMLESVLGAFPAWKIRRQRLKSYTQGSLQDCQSVFYLATNFAQELPLGFADEVAVLSNRIPVIWFNYKFSELAQNLRNRNQDPGFDAAVLIQPDSAPSPLNQDPGFFRFFDYQGESFFKLAQWNPASGNFAASPELHFINIKDADKVEVLSKSRHSKTNATIPYAVRSGNIWYMADSPFSFVHYEDRFYILTDLLWDILSETPPTERIALIRIEDVNPSLDMVSLRWAMDYLADQNVPFSLGVIPWFADIIGAGGPDFQPQFKPITKFPSFVSQLRHGLRRGGSLVMHGSVHSAGCLISGYDGVSGGDYEFWLYPENRPLPFDSIDWATRRLELGIKVFQDLDMKPVAFEVPHYAASVMNYVVFSKMFRWNYHRTIYFPNSINADTALPERLRAFACDPAKCGDERRAILSNLRIEADYTAFGGMALPFIIHKDAYGQSLIPETLGMIDFAFYDPETWRPVSKPEDIIRRARKLKVIRGAAASFFWHPQVLNPNSRYYREVPGSYESMGGKKSLELVVKGLRDLGYEFKSIEDKTLFPEEDVL